MRLNVDLLFLGHLGIHTTKLTTGDMHARGVYSSVSHWFEYFKIVSLPKLFMVDMRIRIDLSRHIVSIT